MTPRKTVLIMMDTFKKIVKMSLSFITFYEVIVVLVHIKIKVYFNICIKVQKIILFWEIVEVV